MKRIAVFLTVLVMLGTGAASAFAAEGLDYSFIESNPDTFVLEADDSGTAFVSAKFDMPSFRHAHSPEGYSSLFYSDIIIINYNTEPVPIWRMWIASTSAEELGITGVTLTLPDSKATFSVKEDVTASQMDEGVVLEQFPIFVGSGNAAFWIWLMMKLEECQSYEDFQKVEMKGTLHTAAGDVEFDVPTDALVNIFFMGEAMLNMTDLETMLAIGGTEAEVEGLEETAAE